jgi:hypothetical protein
MAAPFPQGDQAVAEEVLPNALGHQALGLGGLGQRTDQFLEGATHPASFRGRRRQERARPLERLRGMRLRRRAPDKLGEPLPGRPQDGGRTDLDGAAMRPWGRSILRGRSGGEIGRARVGGLQASHPPKKKLRERLRLVR